MRRKLILASLVFLLAISTLTTIGVIPLSLAGAGNEHVRSVTDSNNELGIALYDWLKRRGQAENIFISPVSISTALAMTYAGARGTTAAEMRDTLRWSVADEDLHPAMKELTSALDKETEGHALSLANALWGQAGMSFREEFLALSRRDYGAGFKQVDFARAPDDSRRTINAWVENQTSHKIKDLLLPGDITSATSLVLTNAIHFKGIWKYRFREGDTREDTFHITENRVTRVKMMEIRGGSFGYLEGDGFQALQLAYAGDELSMIVFLPRGDSNLEEFESKLNASNLETWVSGMREVEMGLVMLPRFELACRFELAETLRELGMPRAFTPHADFSGLSPVRPLFIDDVIHKAFARVNEEGTEAAAATAVTMKRGAAAHVFRADRPFLFVIRDNRTGAVLFLGRLVDPEV